MADNSFINKLIQAESGGNPAASVTIPDGRTFAGLGQFGKARLTDLGMGQDFTYDQYLRNENNLQRTLLDRHLADLDRRIDEDNLMRYEGQTVGGVPVTRNAIYGMAHIGGYGGAKKFLETGGAYNPSDKFDTSISDYGKKFSGPTIAAAEAKKPTKLASFAQSAQDNATRYEQTALEQTLLERNLGGKQAAPVGYGNNPYMAPFMQQPPTLSTQGQPAPAPTTAAPITTAPAAPAADAAEQPEPEALGLLGKLGSMLFPKSEAPDDDFKRLLGGIGVGLGQMSQGQPINLQPYFNGLARQRQAAIDSQLQQEQAAIDNKLREQQVLLNSRQIAATERRLELDERIAQQEAMPLQFDAGYYEALTEQFPELSGLVGGVASAVASNDKDMYDEFQGQLATQLGKIAEAGTTLEDPRLRELFKKYAATDDRAEQANIVAQIPEASREAFGDMAGLLDGAADDAPLSTAGKMLQDYETQFGVQPDDKRQELFETFAKMAGTNIDFGGLGAKAKLELDHAAKMARQAAALKAHEAAQAEFANVSSTDAKVADIFDNVIEYNENTTNAEGGETVGGKVVRLMDQLDVGMLAPVVTPFFEGLTAENVGNLDVGGKYLTFELAGQMGLLNVGFTDSERKSVHSTTPSALNTIEGRVQFMGNMHANRIIDKAGMALVASQNPMDAAAVNKAVTARNVGLRRNQQSFSQWMQHYYDARHKTPSGNEARNYIKVGRIYATSTPEQQAALKDAWLRNAVKTDPTVTADQADRIMRDAVAAAFPTLSKAEAEAFVDVENMPIATDLTSLGFYGYIDDDTGDVVLLPDMERD